MTNAQFWALVEYYGSWMLATSSIAMMAWQIFRWKQFLPNVREPFFTKLIVIATILSVSNIIVILIGGSQAFQGDDSYFIRPMIWISRYRLWANVIPLPVVAWIMWSVNNKTKNLSEEGKAAVTDAATAVAISEEEMKRVRELRIAVNNYQLHKSI